MKNRRNILPASPAISLPVLALWFFTQASLLAIVWSDLQLTARPGSGARQWACQIMLIGQIGLGSLVMPALTGTIRSALIAAAISFPFMQLAAGLGGTAPIAGLRASAILICWLGGLALLNRMGRGLGWLVPSVLAAWVWGSFAVWYLLGDFRPGSLARDAVARVCPLMW